MIARLDRAIACSMPVFALLVAPLMLAVLVTGCARLNPIAAAETPAQKAYAISASYNVLLESAADVVEDTTAPMELRRAVQQTELRTTPVIESLEASFAAYQVARAQFAAGATTADRLEIAAENLAQWLAQAEGALVELAAALAND